MSWEAILRVLPASRPQPDIDCRICAPPDRIKWLHRPHTAVPTHIANIVIRISLAWMNQHHPTSKRRPRWEKHEKVQVQENHRKLNFRRRSMKRWLKMGNYPCLAHKRSLLLPSHARYTLDKTLHCTRHYTLQLSWRSHESICRDNGLYSNHYGNIPDGSITLKGFSDEELPIISLTLILYFNHLHSSKL